MYRRLAGLAFLGLLVGCTAEATVVPADGGSASGGAAGSGTGGAAGGGGGGAAGSAGAAGSSGGAAGGGGTAGSTGGAGGAAGAPQCTTVVQQGTVQCDNCMASKCGKELSDCETNSTDPCSCGKHGAFTGQANCFLACINGKPPLPANLDQCATQCGAQSFATLSPPTASLMNCLVGTPPNPPTCACFGAPP